MKTRWTDDGANGAIKRWGAAHGEALALRLYTANLLGADPALVLHGGGNVSLKETATTILGDQIRVLRIKASGCNLATLSPDTLPAAQLDSLERLRKLDSVSDDEMVNALRRSLLRADAKTPSLETLVHAFLPARYIDHSHADALLAITNQPDGERLVREALGDRVGVVPYVRPGLELAQVVARCFEENPQIEGIVLLHHGLITFANDARTSYERHITIVDQCEKFIKTRAAGLSPRDHSDAPGTRRQEKPSDSVPAIAQRSARIAPVLRGLLACPTGNDDHPFRRSILEWRSNPETLTLLEDKNAPSWASSGPLAGDHAIHTKPRALFVSDVDESDEALRSRLTNLVEAFRKDYLSYVTQHGGSTELIDPSPRVVMIRGVGLFCTGRTKSEARKVADIAEHTLITKAQADSIGTYQSLSADHLFDMEFRTDQRSKLKARDDRPLSDQVVVISGGAGAIGAAIAEVCAEAGAHVAITDIDKERLALVVDRIDATHGEGTAIGVVMDVTDEESVGDGFKQVVRTFGGVDVVVPNAGIAHVASIEKLDLEDFRKVMEVNAVGYFLFMREGIKVLKRQGLGGHIVISASKNVFGPGKDFGAYSASKAAGHQLGKVAAIELAEVGIRVNMINADAIFGDEETPSGLWKTVGPSRAKSRNMKEAQLADYYKGRNLLKTRVSGRHVGNAVVFFASGATPTTGATLPVDGGVVEAFPR